MYTHLQDTFNLDVGVIGGVGNHLNHYVHLSQYVLDDFFDTRNMEKLDYLMEELDSEMHAGYDYLIETEEFDI
jgi:hypothetical protein